MGLIGRVIEWILQDTDEELYSQYQFDVVGCDPYQGAPPITFEEYKKRKTGEYHYSKRLGPEKMNQPINFDNKLTPIEENEIIA